MASLTTISDAIRRLGKADNEPALLELGVSQAYTQLGILKKGDRFESREFDLPGELPAANRLYPNQSTD